MSFTSRFNMSSMNDSQWATAAPEGPKPKGNNKPRQKAQPKSKKYTKR